MLGFSVWLVAAAAVDVGAVGVSVGLVAAVAVVTCVAAVEVDTAVVGVVVTIGLVVIDDVGGIDYNIKYENIILNCVESILNYALLRKGLSEDNVGQV